MPCVYSVDGVHKIYPQTALVENPSQSTMPPMSCPQGGYPILHHNELRDITAQVLTETYHGVGIEPTLQPLSGKKMSCRTANVDDGTRLDVVANNFWGGDRLVQMYSLFAVMYYYNDIVRQQKLYIR